MKSRHEMLLHLENIIARNGWMVQGVFPTEESPGPHFAYSVGLHDKGLPELVMIGLPMEVAGSIINAVAASLLESKAKGESLDSTFTHPAWPMSFHLLEAPAVAAAEYATFAHNRSLGLAKYIQIVWPDKENRLPWHPDATQSFKEAQLLLGSVH